MRDHVEVGKTYTVKHSRKGTFKATVRAINGAFATLDIIEGRAQALLAHNERETGEQVTVRISLAKFEPVEA